MVNNMYNNIKLIIKGLIIGLGKIIPGVSGAVLAMMLNVYEPALIAIANIKTNFYKNIKYLAMLGIGIIFAIIMGSKALIFFLDKFYIQTMFIFIGIMLAGISPITKELKLSGIKEKIIIIFVAILFIYISLIQVNNLTNNNSNILIYFFSGILDAFSSIVPGVSGTVLLMIVGTYNNIIKSFANALNISLLFNNLFILVPFFIGVLIGGYFISKLIAFFFKKYRNITYCCTLGLIIGSLIILILNIDVFKFNIFTIFISIILAIISFVITKKVNI